MIAVTNDIEKKMDGERCGRRIDGKTVSGKKRVPGREKRENEVHSHQPDNMKLDWS